MCFKQSVLELCNLASNFSLGCSRVGACAPRVALEKETLNTRICGRLAMVAMKLSGREGTQSVKARVRCVTVWQLSIRFWMNPSCISALAAARVLPRSTIGCTKSR